MTDYRENYYLNSTEPEDMTYYNNSSYLSPTAPVDECTKSEEKALNYFLNLNDEVFNVRA